MRPIVAVPPFLCSANAVAQTTSMLQLDALQLAGGNDPRPSTLDARRCREASLDRHVLRWLRWRD